MKFTNEQAVEALRAELTNKGRKTLAMSERTLAKQTEILVKKFADDETGLPEFVSDVIEILNTMEGNIRKTNSDFVNKWKEDHPESEPPQNTDDPAKTENPELQKLMERIAALEADKQASEKKASMTQRKKDLAAKFKEKGVKDSEWVEKLLSKVNLDREIEIDKEVDELLPLYNQSRASGGGAVPPVNPSGGSPDIMESMKDVSELAKRQRESLKI